MLTDRQRKLERIVFNVFHIKDRPVTMEELQTFSLLTEEEIRASFQEYEGSVIEVTKNQFVLPLHLAEYDKLKKFGYLR